MRRTKIVCTIGPSTSSPEMIARLIAAGMDVARLNFSHGTHDEHAQRIKLVREAARQADRPLGILQDLQGPKIRTGKLKDSQPVQLRAGDLEGLPGIGASLAERIVEFRSSNGPLKSVDDLRNVKGIGPALFAKIAPLVTVGP